MSRPFWNLITVEIEYDEDTGLPSRAKYHDQEGCGHESPWFDLHQSLRELAEYHVYHLGKSHKMIYPRACPVVIPGTEFRCSRTLEDHQGEIPVRHLFAWETK
jgi:hypothetical protein